MGPEARLIEKKIQKCANGKNSDILDFKNLAISHES